MNRTRALTSYEASGSQLLQWERPGVVGQGDLTLTIADDCEVADAMLVLHTSSAGRVFTFADAMLRPSGWFLLRGSDAGGRDRWVAGMRIRRDGRDAVVGVFGPGTAPDLEQLIRSLLAANGTAILPSSRCDGIFDATPIARLDA